MAQTSYQTDQVLGVMEYTVCIPVYQIAIHELITGLSNQLQLLPFPGEILVMDDGSTESIKEQNRALQHFPGVRYWELPENIGRAAIRNLLASKANGNFLIFVDADVKVPVDFISKYIQQANQQEVTIGGIDIDPYTNHPICQLRYKTALHKEIKPLKLRRTNPYRNFMSGNFMAPRSLFSTITFDASLKNYGHEDTLFGIHLENHKITIRHIHNPVLHQIHTPSAIFLTQTEESIKNMMAIKNKLNHQFSNNYFSLWRFRNKAPHFIRKTTGILFPLLKPALRRQLCSAKPILLLFDLYKFGYLCSLEHQIKI